MITALYVAAGSGEKVHTSRDEVTLNSEDIKPVTLAIAR